MPRPISSVRQLGPATPASEVPPSFGPASGRRTALEQPRTKIEEVRIQRMPVDARAAQKSSRADRGDREARAVVGRAQAIGAAPRMPDGIVDHRVVDRYERVVE